MEYRNLIFALALVTIAVALGSLSANPAANRQAPSDTWSKSEVQRWEADRNEFLDYEDRMRQGLSLSESEKLRYDILAEQFAGEPLRERNGLDFVGGPDAFGYTYVDNQSGDTATYEWIELRGDAQANWLAYPVSHDDAVLLVDFGATIPFYGGNYSSASVSTNGNLQFTTNATIYTNTCLPASGFAGPTILAYWDDLHLDYGGNGNSGSNTVAWRNFGDYVVVEWDSIGHCCSAGTSLKFEVIMYLDGRIKIQYNNLVFGSNANTQTIGIQASGTGPSLEYVCNATAGHQPVNGLAIWFTLGDAGSISGTVLDDGGAPVVQARVWNMQIGSNVLTDNQGQYAFPLVPVGTYTIFAQKRGFESDTASGVIVNADQTTDVDLTLVDLGLLNYISTNVPVNIPLQGVVTSTLTINENININDLDVLLNASHTSVGDLIVSLVSPEGSSVVLINRRGALGDNFTGTALDDEATTPIASGTAPFTGDFIPDAALTAFDGQNAEGVWTLIVDDRDATDSGILLGWELYITPGTQTGGSIEGLVRNSENNAPIPNATVALEGTQLTRRTNAQGEYRFSYLTPGVYALTFSASFFETETIPNVSVTNGNVTTVNANLDGNVIVYNYTGPPVPITDNQTSVAVINVPDDFELLYCLVFINNITHTFDGDLRISVIGPNGDRVLLSNRRGGTGENYIETLFDDDATTPIAQGQAPFTGSFIPDSSLSLFDGDVATGDWTLEVADMAGADQGAINNWTVLFGGNIGPRGDLAGTVTRLSTGEPAAGAEVTILETTENTFCDNQGHYFFGGLDAGTYTLRFHNVGYCDSTVAGIEIVDDQETTANVAMRAPVAQASVTSINYQVVPHGVGSTTFLISNPGNCILTWSITDSVAWLSMTPNQGSILPAQQTEVTVIFDAGNLEIGQYLTTMLLTHSATGGPIQIPVSLDVASGAEDPSEVIPTEFNLFANYPNPFNSSTELRFDVPRASEVTIVVFNLIGQEVTRLMDGMTSAGSHVVSWNGTDARGLDVGTGLYIVQMRADGAAWTRKAMLLR